MKLKLFALTSLLFCALFVRAQGNYEDVVYLKNGSVIRGMIIEQIPNVSIKIKSGPNIFVYKMDEIEKFTKEEVAGSSTTAGAPGDFGFKPNKGYAGNFEIGLSHYPAGNLPMFAVNIVNGYQFSRHFTMGLGVGAEVSTKSVHNFNAGLDMRAYFLKSRVTPFFNFAAGYNAMLQSYEDYYYGGSTTDVYHGFTFAPAFGARVAINKKVAATISLGYRYVGSMVKIDYYYDVERDIASSHAVMLRFGVAL